MSNKKYIIKKCSKLIQKHEKWIEQNLSEESRKVLKVIIPYLREGKSSRYRKKLKNYYKMMVFYFISISYPIGAPVIDDDVVELYMKAVKSVLDACFGEDGRFGISFHARPHYGSNDHRQKTPNFHIILPRILEDKKQVEEYIKVFDDLDEHVKPWNSLFFLKNVLMLTNKEVTNGSESTGASI